jgi:site-specific recombinase XerD
MYERDFHAYLDFARTPEAALDASTLARWLTSLANDTQMSPNTINRMLSAVKRLMKEAAAQGYLSHELAASFEQVKGVKVAAQRERTKTTARMRITPEAVRELTAKPDMKTLIGKRDAALLHTLASSGLHVSEWQA